MLEKPPSPAIASSREETKPKLVIAPDGHTYEEAEVNRWLELNPKSACAPRGGPPFKAEDLRVDWLAIRRSASGRETSESVGSSLCDLATTEAFKRPVTASDGHTYELTTLRDLYRSDFRSPFSRADLQTTVYRNRAIEAEVKGRRQPAEPAPEAPVTPRTAALLSAHDRGDAVIDLAAHLGPRPAPHPEAAPTFEARMMLASPTRFAPRRFLLSPPTVVSPSTSGCLTGAIFAIVGGVGIGAGASGCGASGGAACAAAVLGGGTATVAGCLLGRRLGAEPIDRSRGLDRYAIPGAQVMSRGHVFRIDPHPIPAVVP